MLECRLNVGTVEGFNKMKSIFKVTTVFLALVLLTGCFGEEEKVKAPKKDYIVVKNDSVENFEVKLQTRLKDRVLIPFNETVKIDFLAMNLQNNKHILLSICTNLQSLNILI